MNALLALFGLWIVLCAALGVLLGGIVMDVSEQIAVLLG